MHLHCFHEPGRNLQIAVWIPVLGHHRVPGFAGECCLHRGVSSFLAVPSNDPRDVSATDRGVDGGATGNLRFNFSLVDPETNHVELVAQYDNRKLGPRFVFGNQVRSVVIVSDFKRCGWPLLFSTTISRWVTLLDGVNSRVIIDQLSQKDRR